MFVTSKGTNFVHLSFLGTKPWWCQIFGWKPSTALGQKKVKVVVSATLDFSTVTLCPFNGKEALCLKRKTLGLHGWDFRNGMCRVWLPNDLCYLHLVFLLSLRHFLRVPFSPAVRMMSFYYHPISILSLGPYYRPPLMYCIRYSFKMPLLGWR